MNTPLSRTVAWSVWTVASVFYAYQYLLRVMPNILLPDIMEQFGISAATFGQFSGVYYIGYALMHLPLGILIDRYGPKKIMYLSILVAVLGITPLLFATHWMTPIIGRLLVGIGSSCAILGVFKIVRMSFHEKWFSRMLSFSVTIGLIGAIYGGAPVSTLRETFGYQFVLQTFALVGVLLAILTYLIVPALSTPPQGSILSDLKEVLTHKKVLLSCIFAGLMVGPLEGFADVWGTVFFKEVYGFHGTLAASLPSMIFVGMCFGAPILSTIAEKSGSYLGTIIGAGVVMSLSFAALLLYPLSTQMLTFSFILVGVACSYQILAIYKASTYVREGVAGLTTALANMIIMLFGYLYHTVIGLVINALGGPTDSTALKVGVAVIPAAVFLGVAGFIFLTFVPKTAKEPI